jgi:hypothetical protein
MTGYSDQWARHRRLRFLTFIPLAGCFVCVYAMSLISSPKVHPLTCNIVAAVDVLCFMTFAYNGLKLSRFRCPRCTNFLSRGKRTYRPVGAKGACCRHCGLGLYSDV